MFFLFWYLKIFITKKYGQYWNVSRSCALYIEKKYDIKNVNVVHPFFDDEEMSEFLKKEKEAKKKGVLLLRRRGREIIPDMIKLFPNEKITILNKSLRRREGWPVSLRPPAILP